MNYCDAMVGIRKLVCTALQNQIEDNIELMFKYYSHGSKFDEILTLNDRSLMAIGGITRTLTMNEDNILDDDEYSDIENEMLIEQYCQFVVYGLFNSQTIVFDQSKEQLESMGPLLEKELLFSTVFSTANQPIDYLKAYLHNKHHNHFKHAIEHIINHNLFHRDDSKRQPLILNIHVQQRWTFRDMKIMMTLIYEMERKLIRKRLPQLSIRYHFILHVNSIDDSTHNHFVKLENTFKVVNIDLFE